VTCRALGLDTVELDAEELEEAKTEALADCRYKLKKLIKFYDSLGICL
jgi:hypothetical protein